MRLLRTLALLLSFALVAAGVSACGSESGGNSSDTQALLAQTFGPNHPIRSGRLDLSLNLDLKGVPQLKGPVVLRLSGPFQSNGPGTLPNFQFALDVDAGGRAFTAGAVSTGSAGFLTFEGVAFDVGKDLYASFKKGYEQAAKSSKDKTGTPSLGSLGIKPLSWLKNARTQGTEDVGGTTTEHVTADVDVPRFLDDVNRLLGKAKGLQIRGAGSVPKSLTEQQRRDIARSIKGAKVDIWTGTDDKTLRKIALAVDLDVPQDVRAQVGGLQSGKIAFQFTIADLNKPQKITAPSGARPLSQLTQVLQQLGVTSGGAGTSGSGSAGSGTGSGSGSSGSGSSGSSGSGASARKQQKYLDCLRKAGTDVAQIQKCAALLAP